MEFGHGYGRISDEACAIGVIRAGYKERRSVSDVMSMRLAGGSVMRGWTNDEKTMITRHTSRQAGENKTERK